MLYAMHPPSWHMHQLGRKGAQSAVMLTHLRLAFLQAERYGHSVLVLKLDLRKAYDTILHHDVWVALLRQHYPAALAEVLLQTHRARVARYVTNTGHISSSALLERGLSQGDPTSPVLFTLALQDIPSPLLQQWRREQSVRPCWLHDRVPPLVGFMDDMLLVAAGSRQATQRYHQIQQLLASHGLLLHTAKTAWAASSHEPACELLLEGSRVERRPGITFAGVRYQFGMMNVSDTAVHHHHVPPELLGQASSRIAPAYGVLRMYQPLLELPQAPWRLKAQLLRATAVSSLTYMAQTCQASRQLFLRYQNLELGWLGRFLGLRKHPAESYVDFMRRRRRTARRVFLQSNMGLLSAKLLAQSFAFLGHLVRHSVASACLILEAGPWDIELGQPRVSFFRAGRPARWGTVASRLPRTTTLCQHC